MHDDSKIYLKILFEFANDAANYVRELNNLCDSSNWNSYAIKAHAIKGVCAGLCCEKLRSWALNLELYTKEGNTELCIKETKPFGERLQKLADDIRAVFDKINPVVPQEKHEPLTKEELVKKLQLIADLCSAVMRGETDALEKLETACEEVSGNESTDEIVALINDFEYESAREIALNKINE